MRFETSSIQLMVFDGGGMRRYRSEEGVEGNPILLSVQ